MNVKQQYLGLNNNTSKSFGFVIVDLFERKEKEFTKLKLENLRDCSTGSYNSKIYNVLRRWRWYWLSDVKLRTDRPASRYSNILIQRKKFICTFFIKFIGMWCQRFHLLYYYAMSLCLSYHELQHARVIDKILINARRAAKSTVALKPVTCQTFDSWMTLAFNWPILVYAGHWFPVAAAADGRNLLFCLHSRDGICGKIMLLNHYFSSWHNKADVS